MKDLYIFGAGVMGRVVADAVVWQFSQTHRIVGFFDDGKPVGEEVPGHGRVLGGTADAATYLAGGGEAFLALGSRHRGKALEMLRFLRAQGVRIASLVSPDAHVAPSARIGDNALIMPGAYVGCSVEVGDLFFAYGNATVEHHVRVGHGVLMAPCSSANSQVKIGHGALIGSGAVLANGVEVGVGTLVGTGSVVVKNTPEGVVVFGNPAVVVWKVKEGDEVITPAAIKRLFPPADGG
jgi:sugar O-acyltransferase (sialic acid O-acetyltransferase NeuD family)